MMSDHNNAPTRAPAVLGDDGDSWVSEARENRDSALRLVGWAGDALAAGELLPLPVSRAIGEALQRVAKAGEAGAFNDSFPINRKRGRPELSADERWRRLAAMESLILLHRLSQNQAAQAACAHFEHDCGDHTAYTKLRQNHLDEASRIRDFISSGIVPRGPFPKEAFLPVELENLIGDLFHNRIV